MIRLLRARFHKHYLGRYVHARKLFFFDTILCLSILALGACVIVFRLYDPHVILGGIRHVQRMNVVTPTPSTTRSNIFLIASVGTTRTVSPGDTVPITITIQNGGREALNDIVIGIPLPLTVIDMPRLFASRGVIQDGSLVFTKKERGGLASLPPGEEFSMVFAIPLAEAPSSGDTDLTLTFTPRVRGNMGSESVETRAETETIHIGTAMIAQARLLYYTDDGDQLGRGPLPPVVGRETKYALIISAENTTSRISPLTIVGTLSPKAIWTGKISASHGTGISFDPETQQFHFALENLDPHDTVRLFAEIEFTPDVTDIGRAPVLVEGISINGRDTFTGRSVSIHLLPSVFDKTVPNEYSPSS